MKNPKEIVDEYLVLQYQSGDKEALVKLVKRWHTRIVSQAAWYTGNHDAAGDIAQECWKDVIKSLSRLKNPSVFKIWMHRIIHRRAVDWIRDRQKTRQILEHHANFTGYDDERSDYEESIQIIKNAMKQMTLEQRTILRLFYLENHNLNEISQILSIPLGTVKSRLFHAREKLKKRVKIKYHEK